MSNITINIINLDILFLGNCLMVISGSLISFTGSILREDSKGGQSGSSPSTSGNNINIHSRMNSSKPEASTPVNKSANNYVKSASLLTEEPPPASSNAKHKLAITTTDNSLKMMTVGSTTPKTTHNAHTFEVASPISKKISWDKWELRLAFTLSCLVAFSSCLTASCNSILTGASCVALVRGESAFYHTAGYLINHTFIVKARIINKRLINRKWFFLAYGLMLSLKILSLVMEQTGLQIDDSQGCSVVFPISSNILIAVTNIVSAILLNGLFLYPLRKATGAPNSRVKKLARETLLYCMIHTVASAIIYTMIISGNTFGLAYSVWYIDYAITIVAMYKAIQSGKAE